MILVWNLCVGIYYWGRGHSSVFVSRIIFVAQMVGAKSVKSFISRCILFICAAYLQTMSEHFLLWISYLIEFIARTPPQLFTILSSVFWSIISFTNNPAFSNQWCHFPKCILRNAITLHSFTVKVIANKRTKLRHCQRQLMLEMFLLRLLVFEFILKLQTRLNCFKFFSTWDYSAYVKIHVCLRTSGT